MPRKSLLPQYVNSFKDRHGTIRRYFRRNGLSVALPGSPWSSEFMMAYGAALEASTLREAKAAGKAPPRRKDARKAAAAKAGSFSKLIAEFKKSERFTALAASTAETYSRLLARVDANLGPHPVAKITAKNIRDLIAIRKAEGGPEAANHFRRIMRLLMQFAVESEYRDDDPTLGIKKAKAQKAAGVEPGHRTWTEDDIAKFIKRYPLGTREYLALALLVCVGQRRGDTVKLGPANVANYSPKDFKGRYITLRQGKTGAALDVPILPMLAEALRRAALPADAPAFLLTKFGGPFTPESFSNQFSEWSKLAGIKEQASPHGLRKACARRLAEAGCSAPMIASITGHSSLSEVQRY
ncbi:tyrosine-type recombinase/integrase [Bradyrhizobium sp.]|jgi:integrase